MSRIDLYPNRPVTTKLTMRAGATLSVQATIREEDGSAINLTGATVTFRMRQMDRNAYHIDASATLDDAANGQVSYALTPIATTEEGDYELLFHVLDTSANEVMYPGLGEWTLSVTRAINADQESLLRQAVQAAAKVQEQVEQVVINANTTLDATHIGKRILVQTGGVTITLPDPATDTSFQNGSTITIVHDVGSGTTTLAADISDKIQDTTLTGDGEYRTVWVNIDDAIWYG